MPRLSSPSKILRIFIDATSSLNLRRPEKLVMKLSLNSKSITLMHILLLGRGSLFAYAAGKVLFMISTRLLDLSIALLLSRW